MEWNGVCMRTCKTTCIHSAQYADDLPFIAENRKELQQMLDVFNRACTQWGMKISAGKTKVLNIGEPAGDHAAIYLRSKVDGKGGERREDHTRECNHCLLDVEMEGVPK